MEFGQEFVRNWEIKRLVEKPGAPLGSGVQAEDVRRSGVPAIFRDDEVCELEYQPGAIFLRSGVGPGLG